MKAYALISETFRRKASIRIVHLAWLAIYALIFLFPFTPEIWYWGPFPFGWGGCLLPLMLSEGIFGDDIASGRIRLLVTEPIRPSELYGYRCLGLSLQGAVHLLAAGALILLLHSLTGRGSIKHFAAWLFASWLIFNAWTALSTSLSVVFKRAHNSMLLFVVTAAVIFMLSFLTSFFPRSPGVHALLGVLRYTGPPVELLVKTGSGQCSLLQGMGNIAHSLILTAFYGMVGVMLLSRREFKGATD
jgi:ABC-type transport system involved in multi-copper enzyme maturation permease subunit